MNVASDLAAALLTPTTGCPRGLAVWNGSDPLRRFDVHRNTVMTSLIDVLAESFPVVKALVGEAFFRAMAAAFVVQQPPRAPLLHEYGAGLPAFIGDFTPLASLPYLADVAQLEWLRIESCHAADSDALGSADFQALMEHESQLGQTCFTLHPSLRTLRSAHSVVSLWAAHQGADPGTALGALDLNCPEAALVIRPLDDVFVIQVETRAVDFVRLLGHGMPLSRAVAESEPFDLPAILAVLIRHGVFATMQPLPPDTLHHSIPLSN